MGGFGSGGGRAARRVDEFLRLDMADLNQSWFASGRSGRLTRKIGKRLLASVGFKLSSDRIDISYKFGGVPKLEVIRCDFTNQNIGGVRRWFICPSCARRCRVLFCGASFLCRNCLSATYPSQYTELRIPELAAADRALRRVGKAAGSVRVFPEKPSKMHWRTYRKLEADFYDGEEAFYQAHK